jgi:hypothetical protein
MIGNGYWCTGIVVRWMEGSGWGASARFSDDGFCSDDADAGHVSTEGTIGTRYFVEGGERTSALSAAIDAVKADAERLGITFCIPGSGPATVYYEGDGEDPQWPPPPHWREIVNAQARRLGWEPMYQVERTAIDS